MGAGNNLGMGASRGWVRLGEVGKGKIREPSVLRSLAASPPRAARGLGGGFKYGGDYLFL
ncbi:MAG: hypothetical protein V1889_02230 [archaeon]